MSVVSQAIKLVLKYTEGIMPSFCESILKIFFPVVELQEWAKERLLPFCKGTGDSEAEFWE